MSRFSKMKLANKLAAVELRKLGRTHREIADQLGFSHRAVGRALKRYDQTGSFDQEEEGRSRSRSRARLTTKKEGDRQGMIESKREKVSIYRDKG